jgi:hypothetical protein
MPGLEYLDIHMSVFGSSTDNLSLGFLEAVIHWVVDAAPDWRVQGKYRD